MGATRKLEAIYFADGRVYNTNVTTASTTVALRYEYAIRDHLGNTRLMFADLDNLGTISSNEILQENHFYPFGMNMEGVWMNDAGSKDSKYQYNGKELNDDFGLGWMDYGARWYDAATSRFSAVDPKIENAPYYGTYIYAGNDPVKHIDFNGEFKLDPYFVQRYPNFAKYVAYYLPMLKDNPQVVEAWTKVTGKSEKDFGEMVTYGSGPYISVTRPWREYRSQYYQGLGPFFEDPNNRSLNAGEAPPGFPNNLLVLMGDAEALENAFKTGNRDEIGAIMFLLGVILIHEAGHYGKGDDLSTNTDYKDETGAITEEEIFGKRFSYQNHHTSDFQAQAINRKDVRDYYNSKKGSTILFGFTISDPNEIQDFFKWFKQRSVPQGQKGDPTMKANGDY